MSNTKTYKYIRGRCCCFKVRRPRKSDKAKLLKAVEDGLVNYVIFGYRKRKTTNTPYWRGFVQFPNATSRYAVKEFLPRAHLRRMFSTQAKAIYHCRKGRVTELGKLRIQGYQPRSTK